jgi:hypothetical protein
MAEKYAFEASLFVTASDPRMAVLLASRVAEVVNEPNRWDLEGETDPEPVDVTLRIESGPHEMVEAEAPRQEQSPERRTYYVRLEFTGALNAGSKEEAEQIAKDTVVGRLHDEGPYLLDLSPVQAEAHAELSVGLGDLGVVEVDWPWLNRFVDGEHVGSCEYRGPGSYPNWVEAAMKELGIPERPIIDPEIRRRALGESER